MDILIKGLDLTEGACDINLTIRSDGKVYGSQQVGDRMVLIHTTAVALPPHGRLGDLDKIAKRFHGFYEKHLENRSYETAEIWKYAEQEVRLQGTIVEASNGTDN